MLSNAVSFSRFAIRCFLYSILSFSFIASAQTTSRLLPPPTEQMAVNSITPQNKNEDYHDHEHDHLEANLVLSSLIWGLESVHSTCSMYDAIAHSHTMTLLLSTGFGLTAASAINACSWFFADSFPEDMDGFLDLLGHTAIAYIILGNLKEIGTSYYRSDYSKGTSSGHLKSKKTIFIVLTTTLHFAKAALLSAPAFIDQESILGFFIPLIGVVLPFAGFALNKKVTIGSKSKQVLKIITGITLTMIGATFGASAAISTLGEYMHFDYTIHEFESDDKLISQLLHTVGMEKITVGTIITSAAYLALIICTLIRSRYYKNLPTVS